MLLKSLPRQALVLAASLVVLAAPASGQAMAGFTESADYVVEIDGALVESADVYWSQSARSFLLIAKVLPSPLLVQPASRVVREVPLMKLASRPDGSVEILDGANLPAKGRITLGSGGASFTVDGRQVSMLQKPPLLGWQDAASIAGYDPSYSQRAEHYAPQAKVLDDLRQEQRDVRLVVFFGSWCPFCQQKVPQAMRLAEDLSGTNVDIDFYGLPRSFSGESEAKRYRIRAVPTGVVYVDGKEVGRITGDGWAALEVSLNRLLDS